MQKINITDPRVSRRVTAALAYATTYTHPTVPRSLSTREIDRHLGQIQLPLSKILRKTLLIEHDANWNMHTGKTKKYLLNLEGAKYLHNLLNPGTDYSQLLQHYISAHVDTYKQQMLSGEFEYKESSDRYWHPLQNMPTDLRKREFSRYGYNHIYDIRCAAPSVILYLARDIGVKLEHTKEIEYYIKNRATIRKVLSEDLQISVCDVKQLINMLFNGAAVGMSKWFATTELLRGDSRTIWLVKQHPYIRSLRAEISTVWRKLSNHKTADGKYLIPRHYDLDGNKKRISGSDRWTIYFRYERIIMDAVSDYLDKQNVEYLLDTKTKIKHFREHDGWSCNIQLDLAELTEHVTLTTGINTIEFEYAYYNRLIETSEIIQC